MLAIDLVARPLAVRTGVGRYALALQRELLEMGVEARLTPTFGGALPAWLRRWSRRRRLDAAAFFASYPLRVHHRRGALLHLTTQTFGTLLWLQPGALVTVHDLFPEELSGGSRAVMARLLDAAARLGLRRASAVLTGSEATAVICRAQGLGGHYGVTATSYGVDHRLFRRQPVPERFVTSLGLPEDATMLLYVGTEAPRKQVDLLIRALALLRFGGHSNVVLVKVGAPTDPGRREELRALASALDVAPALSWLDDVREQELAWLYNLADVYVSAASREGFGLPLLEAMACGCPVVASDLPAHREVVGAAGDLVKVGNAEALATAIGAMLSDRDRRHALAIAATERAALFTWRRTAERTLAVYEQIARHQL